MIMVRTTIERPKSPNRWYRTIRPLKMGLVKTMLNRFPIAPNTRILLPSSILVAPMVGDWIVEITVIEGVTASYTFNGQPTSTEKAKTLYGLVSILRTRGSKSTR
jgi:hypothetical protein